MTSARMLNHVKERLIKIRDENTEIFDPSHQAEVSHTHVFLNGAVGVQMPSKDDWAREYETDKETAHLFHLVRHPADITQQELSLVNHNYRSPLRQSQIIIEDGLLILKDHIHGHNSYVKLIIVSKGLRNIIFIAFHSNPIGGHVNVSCTFHRIKLQYYWPGMYSYIKDI